MCQVIVWRSTVLVPLSCAPASCLVVPYCDVRIMEGEHAVGAQSSDRIRRNEVLRVQMKFVLPKIPTQGADVLSHVI